MDRVESTIDASTIFCLHEVLIGQYESFARSLK